MFSITKFISLENKYLIWVILLLAFFLRLYRINNPIADWHSFRQADTASVTREYLKNGINLLEPRYHDLSNIQSGKNNLEGFRMVEFPFINGGIALFIKTFPFLPLEITSRFVSVLFSLGAILSLYILLKTISNLKLALLSSFVMAVLPYSIYYSRVVLPEPFMLFFSLFSLMSLSLWLKEKKWVWYFLSLISLSLALLLKPFVVFLAPVYLSIIFQKDNWNFYKKKSLFPYVILAFLPLMAWRKWILNFPEGIPASDWLLNGNGIRLRPAWFRWIFYERLTKLILGFSGILFLGVNILKKSKDLFIYASWWVGVLAYLIVFASGNVQHDYYQVLLIPIISISVARGIIIFTRWFSKKTSKKISVAFTSVAFLSSLLLSWQQVKGYFNINHWEYVHVGQAVDKILPKNSKLIAPAMGDTVFLFQTNRTGWPIGFSIDEKISLGATHYVTTTYDDEAHELEKIYETIEKNDDYLLLDLKKKLITKN